MSTYRIKFELVRQAALARYSNADPLFFTNTTQTVPNSQIPDEDWYEVTSRPTDNPWDQYRNLRLWDSQDTGFVRNVRLEQNTEEPVWTPARAPWET